MSIYDYQFPPLFDSKYIVNNYYINLLKHISSDYSELIKVVDYMMNINSKSFLSYRLSLDNFQSKLKLNKIKDTFMTNIFGKKSTVEYVYKLISATIKYITTHKSRKFDENCFISFVSFIDMLKKNFSQTMVYNDNNIIDYFDVSYYLIINMINNSFTKFDISNSYILKSALGEKILVPNYVCICSNIMNCMCDI